MKRAMKRNFSSHKQAQQYVEKLKELGYEKVYDCWWAEVYRHPTTGTEITVEIDFDI